MLKRIGLMICVLFLVSCADREQPIAILDFDYATCIGCFSGAETPEPPPGYSGFYVVACQEDFIEPQGEGSLLVIQKDGSVDVHGFIFRMECHLDCTITPCVYIEGDPKLWLGLEIAKLVKERFGSEYVIDLRPSKGE